MSSKWSVSRSFTCPHHFVCSFLQPTATSSRFASGHMLIVSIVTVYTPLAFLRDVPLVSCYIIRTRGSHVCLSVRHALDLDSHQGPLVVRRASCGDWTGAPRVTDGRHVATSCPLNCPISATLSRRSVPVAAPSHVSNHGQSLCCSRKRVKRRRVCLENMKTRGRVTEMHPQPQGRIVAMNFRSVASSL
jgi:hypothetical protein